MNIAGHGAVAEGARIIQVPFGGHRAPNATDQIATIITKSNTSGRLARVGGGKL
jgi:hypothetical protein